MKNGSNYYAKLGLPEDATLDEIKSAYREAARRYHPDVNTQPGETEFFLDIQEAYDILSNPLKKAAFDAKIEQNPSDSAIMLKVIYSRTILPRLEEPQLIYTLIQMTPTGVSGEKIRSYLNTCLIIDRSTSMQGKRMDKVKDTAIEILRTLRPSDRLSIVTFSDYAEVLLPADRRKDHNGIETSIRMLQAGGGTEIFQGLKAGLAQVRRNLHPSAISHMILITDGRTYGDEPACLKLADNAAELGIGISSLGIGSEWNDSFLDNLTARTGGSSAYVSENEDIRALLKQKFHNLSQVYAEHIQYDLKINPEVTLNEVFRLGPEASLLGREPPLRFGSLPYDSNLELLLEFLAPPIQVGVDQITLAKGRLSFDIPLRSESSTSRHLELSLPISDILEPQEPPAAIVRAMKRLTLYRIQERARQEVAEGDLENATRRLQHLATHLLAQGEQRLAQTVLKEAENLEHKKPFSEAGIKDIKYGTRALFSTQDSEDD
jgi:Ca-activated chloride channel family protein